MQGLLLPLLLMLVVAVPLVLGTRKQKKQAQQQQDLQKSLVTGDRVMTTSGLYATVTDASDETTIDLEIAEGVVTTWLRQAVREKIHGDSDALDEEDSDSADESASEVGEFDVSEPELTGSDEDESTAEPEVTAGASLEADKK